MLCHTGELPYQCMHPYCSERFPKKGLMIAHYRSLHEQVKKDSLRFSLSDAGLQRGIASMPCSSSSSSIGEREKSCYACIHPQCKKRFSHESHLRAHLMTHNPGMVAENAFLLSSLQKVLQCVDSLGERDGRVKEQLMNSADLVSVKEQLEKLPYMTRLLPPCQHAVSSSFSAATESSSDCQWETTTTLSSMDSVSRAEHVEYAWSLHRQLLDDESQQLSLFDEVTYALHCTLILVAITHRVGAWWIDID
jgi:hypothetical protein